MVTPSRQNNLDTSMVDRHKEPQQNNLNCTGYFGAAPKRIVLATVLATSIAAQDSIPTHPSQLSFKPVHFQVPVAKDACVKLKNGMTAYLVPDPKGQPLLNVQILIKGGNYLNPAGKEGLVHLLGSQWHAGGTTKTPANQLDELLDFNAMNLHSSMGETNGILSLNLLEKHIHEGLNLLMEVLTQPAFDQDRLERAKKEMRQNMERRNDESTVIEQYQTGFLLRGENHFTNRLPTAASLEAITREDLKALHTKLMHPENFIVSVSGKFDRTTMTKLLNDTLGTLKPAAGSERSPKVPAPSFVQKPGIYVTQKDVNQGRVMLMLPGLRRFDSDWPAVTVMNHILGGGGFSARLVNRIRSEEGLSYTVHSQFGPGDFYPGDFAAFFQTKNASVAFAIRIALEEFRKMRESLVTEAEFKTAKNNIIDGFPTRFDSKAAVATLFAREEHCGAPEDYWISYRDKIQTVTREDVQRVAQKYLMPEKLVIHAVGNVKAMEEGDVKDHPGKLSEVAKLPFIQLPLRDPLTMKPIN